jgi:hypothetical protein
MHVVSAGSVFPSSANGSRPRLSILRGASCAGNYRAPQISVVGNRTVHPTLTYNSRAVCCRPFQGLATIAESELRQNGMRFRNRARGKIISL